MYLIDKRLYDGNQANSWREKILYNQKVTVDISILFHGHLIPHFYSGSLNLLLSGGMSLELQTK